ncbi:MAG TPA: hypothetical protein VK145_02595 [Candidatus Nanoarchaeia archaeon]|nr:hypothetical protein [Candidatus Nanoarchaeia archaeon]
MSAWFRRQKEDLKEDVKKDQNIDLVIDEKSCMVDRHLWDIVAGFGAKRWREIVEKRCPFYMTKLDGVQ